MESFREVFALVSEYCKKEISQVAHSLWIKDIEPVKLEGSTAYLAVRSEFKQKILEEKYYDLLTRAFEEVMGFPVDLVITSLEPTKAQAEEAVEKLANCSPEEVEKTTAGGDYEYTFSTFIVGPSNKFAHAASLAVATNPAGAYNPLFIYGGSGLGKTHLLYAIANELRRHNPNLKVVYIKGDQFTNELIDALKAGKNVEFRNKYRGADLFLVDDIQFIAGKDSTQEEFFHTFNTLYEDHKQIVLTSDRKPDEMATLEDRLRTRFQWGLIADIKPPDYETRMAIIKNKAISLNLDLPNDVCSYIANNITNNVRQIEGTIKKILAYYNLNNMPLDLPNVSRAIDDMFKVEGNAVPTPNLIINQVSKFYSIDETVLRGTLKNKGTAEARQVAMYLIRTMTNLSLPEIGREFGRDHSTVIHSIKKVELSMKDSNSPVACNVRDITSNINSSL